MKHLKLTHGLGALLAIVTVSACSQYATTPAVAGSDAMAEPASAIYAVSISMMADPYLGRISTGSAADLVFVVGDPLSDIDTALNVVAVVRNGRFYSVSGLIDRAKAAETVE